MCEASRPSLIYLLIVERRDLIPIEKEIYKTIAPFDCQKGAKEQRMLLKKYNRRFSITSNCNAK